MGRQDCRNQQGNATLLYYMTGESQEGSRAFLEKRKPDFSKFPKFP